MQRLSESGWLVVWALRGKPRLFKEDEWYMFCTMPERVFDYFHSYLEWNYCPGLSVLVGRWDGIDVKAPDIIEPAAFVSWVGRSSNSSVKIQNWKPRTFKNPRLVNALGAVLKENVESISVRSDGTIIERLQKAHMLVASRRLEPRLKVA